MTSSATTSAITEALAADPIVVTGMGCWAAGARGPDELFRAALGGRSPAGWVEVGTPEEPSSVAACVAGEPELPPAEQRSARRLDRAARLGLTAALQAWRHAGLAEAALDPERLGVIAGTGRGPIGRTLETARDLAQGNVGPGASADSTPGSISGAISRSVGARGPGSTVVATCASAATAIATAAMHLLLDGAEAMLAGGTEAPIVPLMVAQLGAAGVLGWDPDPALTCRPFDVSRTGLVVGEGAAFLVLERASAARRRGATAYARLAGWATGTDAGGRTGMTAEADGLVAVSRRALAVADMVPADIGYVNAHGTGTRLNDRTEARGLCRIFGDGRVPPVSSTKPVTGHCLGATPALEALIAISSLQTGCLPPTANLATQDPDCRLDVIAGLPRSLTAGSVLSTSMGFWGMVGVLVFSAPDR